MESIPQETETIAHKRAERLTQKLRNARARIALKNTWWTSEAVELGGLFVLLIINFIVISPFFGQSADSLKFSGPVVPFLAKSVSLTGVPFLYAVQLVNVIFYLILPVTFYYFVKFVTGRKFAAYLSTIILSMPVSVFAKSRVEFGMLSHESAYIAGIAFLPIGLITLLKFLKNGGVKNLVWASVILTFIALISPFGVFVFAVLAVVTTFSEMLLGEGRVKLLRMLTVLVFGGALSSFWYNPALFFWMLTGPMGNDFRGMLGQIVPMSFFAVPLLASLGYLIFDRKPALQPLFLALFYSILFLIIVIAREGLLPSNPGRYVPMFGFSLAFFIGIGTLMGFEHFHFSKLSKLVPIKGTKDAFLIIIALMLIVFTITGRGMVLPEDVNVLGLFTEVQKGDVWTARDEMNLLNAIPGYIITMGAAALLFKLYKKSVKETTS